MADGVKLLTPARAIALSELLPNEQGREQTRWYKQRRLVGKFQTNQHGPGRSGTKRYAKKRIRKPLLYPAELRGQAKIQGRGERWRNVRRKCRGGQSESSGGTLADFGSAIEDGQPSRTTVRAASFDECKIMSDVKNPNSFTRESRST